MTYGDDLECNARNLSTRRALRVRYHQSVFGAWQESPRGLCNRSHQDQQRLIEIMFGLWLKPWCLSPSTLSGHTTSASIGVLYVIGLGNSLTAILLRILVLQHTNPHCIQAKNNVFIQRDARSWNPDLFPVPSSLKLTIAYDFMGSTLALIENSHLPSDADYNVRLN